MILITADAENVARKEFILSKHIICEIKFLCADDFFTPKRTRLNNVLTSSAKSCAAILK